MATSTKVLVQRFIKLDQQISKKDGELDKLKEERAALEAQLLPRFEEAGIASMKSTAKVTVYTRRDLWAGSADKDNKKALYDAIKDIPEICDLVQETVNTQTFSAYVREKAKEVYGEAMPLKTVEEIVQALPAGLQPVVTVTEKFSLRCRKG